MEYTLHKLLAMEIHLFCHLICYSYLCYYIITGLNIFLSWELFKQKVTLIIGTKIVENNVLLDEFKQIIGKQLSMLLILYLKHTN